MYLYLLGILVCILRLSMGRSSQESRSIDIQYHWTQETCIQICNWCCWNGYEFCIFSGEIYTIRDFFVFIITLSTLYFAALDVTWCAEGYSCKKQFNHLKERDRCSVILFLFLYHLS